MRYISPAERIAVRAQDLLLVAGFEREKDPAFYERLLKDLRCVDNARTLTGPKGDFLKILDKSDPDSSDIGYRGYLLLFLYAYCVYSIRTIEMQKDRYLALEIDENGFWIRPWFTKVEDGWGPEQLCIPFDPERASKPMRLRLEIDDAPRLRCEGWDFTEDTEALLCTQKEDGFREMEHLAQWDGQKDHPGEAVLAPEELLRLESSAQANRFLFLRETDYEDIGTLFPPNECRFRFALTYAPSVADTESVPVISPRTEGFLSLRRFRAEALYVRADSAVELVRRHPWVYVFDRWFEIAAEVLRDMA